VSDVSSSSLAVIINIIRSILVSTDTLIGIGAAIAVPITTVGYRIGKEAMRLILFPTKLIFQQWLSGAIIYAIMCSFPTAAIDLLPSYLPADFLNFFYQKSLTIFMSQLPPKSITILLTIGGTVANSLLPINNASNALMDSISKVVGIPFRFFDNSIVQTMKNRWEKGGWKSLFFFMSSLCLTALGLWMATPTIVSVIRSSPTPQIFYDLQAYLNAKMFTTDGSFVSYFFEATRFALVTLGLSTFSFDAFTGVVTNFFNVLTGETILNETYNFFQSLFTAFLAMFSNTSIVSILSGNVKVEASNIGTGDAAFADWFKNIDIHTIVPSIINEALTGEARDTFVNRIKTAVMNNSRYFNYTGFEGRVSDYIFKLVNGEDFDTSIFNVLNESAWYAKLNDVPIFTRVVVLIRILQAVGYSMIPNIADHLKTLASILIAVFFVGIAWWFTVKRAPMDKKAFDKIVNDVLNITKIYNELNSFDPDYSVVEQATSNKKIKQAITAKDYNLVFTLFVDDCKIMKKAIAKFAVNDEPNNENENIVYRKMVPILVKKLDDYVIQIDLIREKKFTSATQADIDKVTKRLQIAAADEAKTEVPKIVIQLDAPKAKVVKTDKVEAKGDTTPPIIKKLKAKKFLNSNTSSLLLNA
jgi:hypothetical protein